MGLIIAAGVIVFLAVLTYWCRHYYVVCIEDEYDGIVPRQGLDSEDWTSIIVCGFLLTVITLAFPVTLPLYGAYKIITRPIPESKRGTKEFIDQEDWVTRK